MINTSENLIIIKGQVKTNEIVSCQNNNGKYDVIYRNSTRIYSYKEENVLWLTNPTALSPKHYQLIHGENVLFNIKQILVFGNSKQSYWHICFQNGKEYDYKRTGLQVIHSCLEEDLSKNVFEYLKEIAAANKLRAKNGMALLSRQYEKINFIADDRAIAPYLNPGKYKLRQSSVDTLIFPFGCNASQQKAVQVAFNSQISIIQGPPGTGKTQTILNIIANILIQKKTVQVVSNNNSAIANVLEKLDKYEMGFIVALLGSGKNKKKFIKTQTKEKQYPKNISSWYHTEMDDPLFLHTIQNQIKELEEMYAKQERLAIARQEEQTIEIEKQHFLQEFGNRKFTFKLRKRFSSTQLLHLWNECQYFVEKRESGFLGIMSFQKRLIWLFFRIRSHVVCKIPNKAFFNRNLSSIIADFQLLFYQAKQVELKAEIDQLEKELAIKNVTTMNECMVDTSMKYLKNKLYSQYGKNKEKTIFSLKDLKNDCKSVQEEYPIILSTTFSSLNSLKKDAVYDYLIMDEASQVSVETGALALSCAKNAVIVGDTMQLSNVLAEKDKAELKAIANKHQIGTGYDCANISFLQSLSLVIPYTPQTLLREHYRCHPKIINFCNQKFYGGNLIIMTRDQEEENVIGVIKTVKGNHSRDHFNQREIDVINEEILPTLSYDAKEIGIIAPYNNQVNAAKSTIGSEIDVATIHKFQGREKNAIIMTTVDDIISSFSDDPNLLNVAVSRAKQQFYIVVSGNKQPKECNISDLIAYIKYNNGMSITSQLHSIFDYLYKQYAKVRVAYLKKHKRISEYDSENLTFALIESILHDHINMSHLSLLCHFPLYMLIKDSSLLNEEEQKYAANINTHIDFLIYNQVSKQPVLAVETDGYTFHRAGTSQSKRDLKKNHILELYNIPLVRLSTIGHNEEKIITDKLMEILQYANGEIIK